MRIASRCLPKRRDHLSKYLQPLRTLLRPVIQASRRYSVQRTFRRNSFHDDARSFCSTAKSFRSKQDVEQRFSPGAVTHTLSGRSRRIQPAELVAKLDKYLPPTIDGVFPRTQTTEIGIRPLELTLGIVDRIYSRAKNQLNIELFEWMIENGYDKAATWVIGEVLRKLAAKPNETIPKTPSNISWSNVSLLSRDIDQGPIEVTRVNDRDFRPLQVGLDASPSGHGRPAHLLQNVVWSTLGRLVIKAADLDLGESTRHESRRLMSAVFLILGHIHNLGFMPDNIYAYDPSLWSTYVQRPPILHLISSRILTSLSDASWRDTLIDAMAQATARGISLEKLTQTVAGSRFNVRVRDLGHEVWLELILWCCVETDQRSAAVSIIRALQERHDHPWFAVAWNSSLSRSSNSRSVTIDWERVKLRTGGTVGSIEGYSLEKPLIDVPPRTISVEVVLAVIELCINTCGGGAFDGSNVRTVDAVQSDIADVIAFLEPHDLPLEYFDYLGSRLMFAADFESVKSPASLQKWANHLHTMQKLETVGNRQLTIPDLSLESILSHTQFRSSIQQQALDRLIQNGDVHNSLQLFNDIQETIDQNKFNSISEFLQMQPASTKDFFSARPFTNRLEYVDSYGQVPYHRLASFLNLLSENNMTGMGQWLLYADEVDGAVIPLSAYQHSSMTAALLKFAVVSEDEHLRRSILRSRPSTKRLPTVRYLRQMVNTSASIQDFYAVREFLKLLRLSEGGGVGIENIVYLAAMLLRLEHGLAGRKERKATNLQMTTTVLEEILRGVWDTVRGSYSTYTRRLFLQNVALVLKVFACTESSALQTLAQSHIERFPSRNMASLPARHFNTLLSAVVDVYGSPMGRRMWILFCGNIIISEDIHASEVNFDDSVDDANNVEEYAGSSVVDLKPGDGYFPASEKNTATNEIIPEVGPRGIIPLADCQKGSQVEEEDGKQQHTSSSSEASFSDPFFPDTQRPNDADRLLQPIAVTRPNMHTVRIIVGAAIKEQRILRHDGLLSPRQDDILAWAYWMFRSLSAADEKLIEQEIQQPVSNLSDEIKRHLERNSTNQMTGARRRLASKSDEHVSPLWGRGEQPASGSSLPGWLSRRPLLDLGE